MKLACEPVLTAHNSTLRTQFQNFTNVNAISNSSSPVVPIVFEATVSNSLIQTLGSSLQGLVVISSQGSNTTTSSVSLSNVNFPVVFAQDFGKIGFIRNTSIPTNAISAGYLTPVQAQILLSVAIANNVNSTESLKMLYP